MTTTIEAPFTLADKDRKTIKDKINDLKKYESRMTQINVFFKADDGNLPDAILAQIRIRVPGKDVFVENSEQDAMQAFGSAYDSAKRQLKKRRDILNDQQSPVKELRDIVYDNL